MFLRFATLFSVTENRPYQDAVGERSGSTQMLFLRLIGKLARLLRAGASPAHIAGGFVMGMMIGFLSLKTLFAPFIILLLIIFNVNISSAIFGAVLFRLIAYLIDPLLHSIGYWILVDIPALQDTWTFLYNIPVVRHTRFNNTVILGSLLAGLCLIYPVFTGVRILVVKYRERYEKKIRKWKIVQVLRGSKVFQFLGGIRNW